LSAHGFEQWQSIEQSTFWKQGLASGEIVGTRPTTADELATLRLGVSDRWVGFLEHDRIPFISYPYEWTFGMLRDAALSQLTLLQRALAEGFTIKDGTAYNTQWRGVQPTFIDVASFERWPVGIPWTGYRQFCQTFLYPLFFQAYKNVAFHPWLRGRLDGIAPEDFNNLCSWRDLFRRGVFVHAFLHARLQSSRAIGNTDVRKSLSRDGLEAKMVLNTVGSLHRLVEKLKWKAARSTWSDYAPAYTDDDWTLKQQFVRDVLRQVAPAQVWDLGCNTGTFSRLAAEQADCVVALDGDHLAVEKLYQSLRAESGSLAARRILPLVGNVVDSSPDLGWRGTERKSWAHRGRPDLVLALALVHHVVLGAGVPLAEFIDWLASLGGAVVLEFVDKEDPQARRVLHNRGDDDPDYSLEACVQGLKTRFGLVRHEPLKCGTRTLLFAQPR
ncbi:MAG: class I SAM-dependent methyltransferase, partial [Planctomycetota bacterium]|nr:class I SAM-dependent methyltransferase [Planctomycetota bacterium]